MTVAVVADSYVFVMRGVNAPNEAGVPSVSDRVAATEPPALPSAEVSDTGSALSPETAKLFTEAAALPLVTVKSHVTCGTRTSR